MVEREQPGQKAERGQKQKTRRKGGPWRQFRSRVQVAIKVAKKATCTSEEAKAEIRAVVAPLELNVAFKGAPATDEQRYFGMTLDEDQTLFEATETDDNDGLRNAGVIAQPPVKEAQGEPYGRDNKIGELSIRTTRVHATGEGCAHFAIGVDEEANEDAAKDATNDELGWRSASSAGGSSTTDAVEDVTSDSIITGRSGGTIVKDPGGEDEQQ